MTNIYTNYFSGEIGNRQKHATHITARPKRRLDETSRVSVLFLLPPFSHLTTSLGPQSVKVRDNNKLSYLPYPWLVRSDYNPFHYKIEKLQPIEKLN